VGQYCLSNPIKKSCCSLQYPHGRESRQSVYPCAALGPSVTHRTSPTATYTLIYAFLTDKSLTKTAQALKKEVRDVVVLKDGLKPESPSLDVILQQWKSREEQTNKPIACVPMIISCGRHAHLFSDRPRLTVCIYCICISTSRTVQHQVPSQRTLPVLTLTRARIQAQIRTLMIHQRKRTPQPKAKPRLRKNKLP
jgi:hypothetical protein